MPSGNILWGGNGIADFSYGRAGIAVRLISVPARGSSLGGDIYYVTIAGQTPVSTFLLVDVSGHGLATSELFHQLRGPLESLIDRRGNTELFHNLNGLVLNLEWHGNYATASAGTYDHEEKIWRFAYAGHPDMLIHRDGNWQTLAGHAGRTIPMGIVDDPEFQDTVLPVHGFDAILMYTDGLTDIRGSDGRRLGAKGVLDILNTRYSVPSADFLPDLRDELYETTGGNGFDDDLTLISIRFTDEAPSPPERE